MRISRFMFLLVEIVLLSNSVHGALAPTPSPVPIQYTYMDLTTSDTTTPAWSKYTELPLTPKTLTTTSSASYADDVDPFDATNFCAPFYGTSRSLFITSNGFLAFTPHPMCPSFCSSSIEGYYKANPVVLSGGRVVVTGANLALIGVYVHDLDPRQGLVRYMRRTVWDGVESLIVEYANVTMYADTAAQRARLSRAHFQVEVLKNGTIFFRYAAHTQEKDVTGDPYIGIVLSETQRVSIKYRTTLRAVRFDPNPHTTTCYGTTQCQACMAMSGCSWCTVHNACYNATVISDFCGISEQYCGGAPINTYYTQSLRDGAIDESLATDVTANRIAPLVDTPYTSIQPSFLFPFYYNPPSMSAVTAENNPNVHNTLYISSNGFISMVPHTSHSCTTFCHVSQYGQIIAPLLINLDTTNSSALYYKLGSNYVKVQWHSMFLPTMRGLQNLTFSATLFSTGTIVFRYSSSYAQGTTQDPEVASGTCRDNFYAFFPLPPAGIIQMYDKYPTSSLVPAYQIYDGLEVTFTPVPGCLNDCRQRGVCDRTSRKCQCTQDNTTSYAGDDCSVCSRGFYGQDCRKCPACQGGVCDEGINGTGQCICNEWMSGQYCEKKCEPGSVKPLNCSGIGCNGVGSYCDCGKCVCRPSWSGPTCSEWTDPCRGLSIYGCDICLQPMVVSPASSSALPATSAPTSTTITSSQVRCAWCPLDKRCYPSLRQDYIPVDTPRCTTALERTDIAKCPAVPDASTQSAALNSVVIAVIFLLLGVCGGIILTMIGMFRKTRAQFPITAYTTLGTTSLTPRNTIREVATVSRVIPQSGPVQGIPLSQINLWELQERQEQQDLEDPQQQQQHSHNGYQDREMDRF
eukprot:PhF_6_TR29352/c0_g1_i5/m.43152